MNVFSIKDVENLSGIQAHTLRIWEQRYTFLKPQRTQTNIRNYTEKELRRILNVALLNRFGVRISRIDRMSEDEISKYINELSSKPAAYQKTIQLMLEQMLDVRLKEFEQLLTQTILELGIQQCMQEVIFPFLEKIGNLWVAGQIFPAQEHFVTYTIRQKLIAAIDALPVSDTNADTILLFIPEGEINELSILYAQYKFKNQGFKTYNLGTNVPVKDALFIAEDIKPAFIYVNVAGTAPAFSMSDFVNEFKNSSIKVKLSGAATVSYNAPLPENVEIVFSTEDVFPTLEKQYAAVSA